MAEALRPFIDRGFGVGAWLTDITDPSAVRITTPVLAGAPAAWFDELMGLLNAIPAPAHHRNALADRLWVKDSPDPDEEKLRIPR